LGNANHANAIKTNEIKEFFRMGVFEAVVNWKILTQRIVPTSVARWRGWHKEANPIRPAKITRWDA
jgi:hypothetical protein